MPDAHREAADGRCCNGRPPTDPVLTAGRLNQQQSLNRGLVQYSRYSSMLGIMKCPGDCLRIQ